MDNKAVIYNKVCKGYWTGNRADGTPGYWSRRTNAYVYDSQDIAFSVLATLKGIDAMYTIVKLVKG